MPNASQLSQLPTKYSGLRYIAFKSQVLISTGIISLDAVLGGGIPLGSVLLIEEDEYGVFSEMLMRHYYGEGVASKQALFLASPDNRFRNLIYRLPQVAKAEEVEEDDLQNDFKMKIAWRYQSNTEASSKPATLSLPPNFGHHFDLSTNVSCTDVESADITICPEDIDGDSSYAEVLKKFSEAVSGKDGPPTRLGVHCLGSSNWSGDDVSLLSFLYALRCLVHNNYCSVAVVTISPKLIRNRTLINRCEDICDTVISLESLVNNSNPIYTDYKALVNIHKYPSINSLSAYRPEANDWALKLNRRKCYIEKLHIPAEVDTGDKKGSTQSSPLCQRPAGNIDF